MSRQTLAREKRHDNPLSDISSFILNNSDKNKGRSIVKRIQKFGPYTQSSGNQDSNDENLCENENGEGG